MARGGVAAAIRRATADLHVRAEQVVLATRPFDSRERYDAYLARMWGFYARLEPALFAAIEDVIDTSGRSKLGLIRGDLEALGWTASEIAALPVCPSLPPLRGAHAFGVAYVLEGKTLGSRFLLAEAERALGLGAASGASFFAGYGADTSARWRTFLEELERVVADRGCRIAVLEGARETFRVFTRWVAPLAALDETRSPPP